MKHLAHLATRIFNTPLLISPAKLNTILSVLGPRLGLAAEMIPAASDPGDAPANDPEPDYAEAGNGIAVISIVGPLVKRSAGIDALSGGPTTYASIQEEIEDAITDPKVNGIVFDIDSPGGEAPGMFELADFIYSLRGQKPMYAVANDMAFSAAYALASCADKLYLTRFGGVGSIGCYMLHIDQSEWDKEAGIKFEYIHAGAKKVDGNPHEPLSDSARAEFQNEVDQIRDGFVSLVARNRSVTAESVLATQAGCFMGADALPLLADKVGTLEDALGDMARLLDVPAEPAPAAQGSDPDGGGQPDDWMAYRADIGPTVHYFKSSLGHLIARDRQAKVVQSGAAALDCLHAERRFLESQPIAGVDGRRIDMLVVPYGSLSCDLGGFREMYAQGCFADGLSADLRVLFNHNYDKVLGRKSARTASFWEDRDGVHVECDAPETHWADDLLVSMRRRDITQGSAAFYILDYHWEVREGERVRVIERARMREASVHSFPAYESTRAVVQPASSAQSADGGSHELELAAVRLRLLSL